MTTSVFAETRTQSQPRNQTNRNIKFEQNIAFVKNADAELGCFLTIISRGANIAPSSCQTTGTQIDTKDDMVSHHPQKDKAIR